jgi:hypothetical protein
MRGSEDGEKFISSTTNYSAVELFESSLKINKIPIKNFPGEKEKMGGESFSRSR